MGDIKSAREIAMEKVEKLGTATNEERLKWKYAPEGEKLAARYLKQDCNLTIELSKYEAKEKEYMEGLKSIKSDRVGVENVYSKIRQIFDHYVEQGEQQRKQAYESLKIEFEAKIQQALQQQAGSLGGVKIDVEKQPQFQEEWRKIQAQLDSQYIRLLDEYKQELLSLP
jgi:hypothetical protein